MTGSSANVEQQREAMRESQPNLPAKHLALSILTGLLLVLLFPNFSLGFLAWIALVPLLLVIYEAEPKLSFFLGWLSGIIFFAGLNYWLLVLYSLVNILAILAWTGLAVFEGLFIGVFALGASIIRRNYAGWVRLFVIPAGWVGLELIRSVGWWGFPWGLLGYSQQPFFALTQIASVTGVYGVSFLIFMLNVSLIEILTAPLEKRRNALRYLLVALIVMSNVVIAGSYMLKSTVKNRTAKKSKSNLRVVAVQGSISQEDKWDPSKEDYIKRTYYRLTDNAKKYRPYLVVWPETAHPSFLLHDQFYLNRLKLLAKRNDYYLIVGSLHLGDKSRQYNSAIQISPRGRVLKRYEKIHLVLFGEYIPFEFIGDIFSRFEKLSWLGESIMPGNDYTVFTTERGKFSTVICFESADANLCRRMVGKGARLLTVITNDAWFGKTAAAAQHLQISSFRAVENGVYLLQVANTGISGVVDPRGRILTRSSLFKRQLLAGEVSFKDSKTFYNKWGDVFAYLCLLLFLGCLIRVFF